MTLFRHVLVALVGLTFALVAGADLLEIPAWWAAPFVVLMGPTVGVLVGQQLAEKFGRNVYLKRLIVLVCTLSAALAWIALCWTAYAIGEHPPISNSTLLQCSCPFCAQGLASTPSAHEGALGGVLSFHVLPAELTSHF